MSSSIKIHGVTLTTGNAKIGRVLNISLPPPRTCDTGSPCYRGGCYAMRHCYLPYKSVRAAWDGNWNSLRRSRDEYFAAVDAALAHSGILKFRWHVGGDIPDADYLRRMVVTAVMRPEVSFWCTTKRFEIAEAVRRERASLPGNLSLVLSMWPGLDLPKGTLKRWPVAWMRDSRVPDSRIPNGAFKCPGRCDKCGHCWKMKAGDSVVFEKH